MPWRTNLVLDTLDAVLDLHVEVAKALDVLLRSLPVTAPVRLQEVGNHLAEGVRVGLHEPLLHLGILHVHVVGVLVHPVVHLTGGGGPAEGVVEALLNLARALVARSEHALVPLGVEQLGAGVQAHRLGEERTWAFAVVVSAMKDEGILPSLRTPATSLVGSESK